MSILWCALCTDLGISLANFWTNIQDWHQIVQCIAMYTILYNIYGARVTLWTPESGQQCFRWQGIYDSWGGIVDDISFHKIFGRTGWQWSCDDFWSWTVGPDFYCTAPTAPTKSGLQTKLRRVGVVPDMFPLQGRIGPPYVYVHPGMDGALLALVAWASLCCYSSLLTRMCWIHPRQCTACDPRRWSSWWEERWCSRGGRGAGSWQRWRWLRGSFSCQVREDSHQVILTPFRSSKQKLFIWLHPAEVPGSGQPLTIGESRRPRWSPGQPPCW